MTDAPKTMAEMREASADRAERRGFATLAAEIRAIPLPADDAEMVARQHIKALLSLHIAHHNNPVHGAARAFLSKMEVK